jgi:hypothetical protein
VDGRKKKRNPPFLFSLRFDETHQTNGRRMWGGTLEIMKEKVE